MNFRNLLFLFVFFFGTPLLSQNVVFDQVPLDNQLFQRNVFTNSAAVTISGQVRQTSGYSQIRVELRNEQGLVTQIPRSLNYSGSNASFSIQINVPAARNNHTIIIAGLRNGSWQTVREIPRILAGDIYIINGQSNAQASAAPDLSDVDEYTRSWFEAFGWSTLNQSFPGEWGARLAKNISLQENLPVAIFNQAVGAEPINTYLKNQFNEYADNYGSLLKRFDDANMPRRARAAFWFHGEANSWGTPTQEYIDDFTAIKNAWEADYGIEHAFIFQMRYQSCTSEQPLIMEAHRQIAHTLPRMSGLASTNAHHDACHFYYQNGYQVLGDRMSNLVTNKLYGGNDQLAYSMNIASAKISTNNPRKIELTFDRNLPLSLVGTFPVNDFKIENSNANITSGQVVGSTIELFLDQEIITASGISYLGHRGDFSEATPTRDWITNSAGVGIFTFYQFPIDGVADNSNTCLADYTVSGSQITVSNLFEPIVALKILGTDYSQIYACDNWGANPCDEIESITLSPGTYFIRIQTYYDINDPLCDIFEEFEVTGTNPPPAPCQNSGGDADGDGVCANEDCNDNNPNISRQGDACNDFNPNTTNDRVQADCSCRGTQIDPCQNNGGDADGDGVCANIDCDDNNPNISRQGDACNDFNPNTTNDRIQADCSCRGTQIDPCQNNGGDADGDGVCANTDCDDNNPNISRQGDACNDFNPNPTNDRIQADCSCRGTVIPSNSCTTTYEVDGNELTISNLSGVVHFTKIMKADFSTEFECNSWMNPCDANFSHVVAVPGTYYLQIQTFNSWTTPAICNIFETITITSGTNGGNTGGTCVNLTSGGRIDGTEVICPDDIPSPITSSLLPSGGTGTIEYRWLSSASGCPTSLSQTIDGANQSTYSPSQLSETTYFRRLAKRENCTNWFLGETNCVVKYIGSNCVTTPPPPTSGCTATYQINGNEVTVSGLNYPITSVKIQNNTTFSDVFSCDDWTSPCGDELSTTLPSGKYLMSIQTFETWTDQKCNILETIEIGGNALRGSNTNSSNQTGSVNLRNGSFDESQIDVFPNPANDYLNVSLEAFSGRDLEIQLVNQLGKSIQAHSILDSQKALFRLSLEEVQNGIYTVWIHANGQRPISKRVLVQRNY